MDPKEPIEELNTSDNDSGERPIRKKLKETSINSAATSFTENHPPTAEGEQKGADSRASSRGRKRSHDESEAEKKDEYVEGKDGSGHRRKRSRDSNVEEGTGASTPPKQPQNADGASENIMSPKKKRSRDQLDKDESKSKDVAGTAEEGPSAEKAREEGERETKRHRDSSQERDTVAKPKPLTSAFSNTSAVSPFGSLASSKLSASKEEESPKKAPVTSSSAFASSSLAAFASSEQSPFGSLGKSTTPVFKSASTSEPEKPSPVGFAAAAGPSPFATTAPSGFAALGSGFSSFTSAFPKIGQTGALTSFASPDAPGIIGVSKPKPLGAPEDEEEEKEKDEADLTAKSFEKEKPDERFQKQHVETGEEEEKTCFSCRGKLFLFSEKQWKERGIGTFKVNVKEPDEYKGTKKTARMIMRADGVLRVMLNAPVFKGMAVGDIDGNEPKTKQVNLASVENGRSVLYLLRTGNEETAKQLYHAIHRLQEEL